jgi:hypothetical protein
MRSPAADSRRSFPSHNVNCEQLESETAQKTWGFSPDHKGKPQGSAG